MGSLVGIAQNVVAAKPDVKALYDVLQGAAKRTQ
jgi:hypothetical protein